MFWITVKCLFYSILFYSNLKSCLSQNTVKNVSQIIEVLHSPSKISKAHFKLFNEHSHFIFLTKFFFGQMFGFRNDLKRIHIYKRWKDLGRKLPLYVTPQLWVIMQWMMCCQKTDGQQKRHTHNCITLSNMYKYR